jgi:hypothetical protein
VSAPGAHGRLPMRTPGSLTQSVGPRRARTAPTCDRHLPDSVCRPPARTDGSWCQRRRPGPRWSAPGAHGRLLVPETTTRASVVGPRRARTAPGPPAALDVPGCRPPARTDGSWSSSCPRRSRLSAPGAHGRLLEPHVRRWEEPVGPRRARTAPGLPFFSYVNPRRPPYLGVGCARDRRVPRGRRRGFEDVEHVLSVLPCSTAVRELGPVSRSW